MIKYSFSLLAALLLMISRSINATAKEDIPDSIVRVFEQPSSRIAILGVFHFEGSPGDLASIKVEGILEERRQQEIEQVLIRLEKYRPDKILLEYPYSQDEQVNKEYRKYLDGELELTASERQQIGFRLAKRLGHKRVYPVDHRLSLSSDKLQEYAEKHGQMDKLEKFITGIRAMAEEESKYLETHTILDCLTKMNTDTSDLLNKNFYLGTMLEMGDGENNPGAELTGEWYKRNLYILANIVKAVEPGEHVLLVIGSGHRAILKQFIKDKDDLMYEEIHDYLSGI